MSVTTAVVSASPSISPAVTVVKTQVTQVTPENVKQFLSLLLLVATGWGASFAHSLLAPNKWHKINVLLLFGYSAVLAVLDLFLQGKLHQGNLIDLGYAFLAVMAAATARYNLAKLGDNKETAPVVVETTAPVATAGF